MEGKRGEAGPILSDDLVNRIDNRLIIVDRILRDEGCVIVVVVVVS